MITEVPFIPSQLSIGPTTSTNSNSDDLTEEECDKFQKGLNKETIDSIWEKFRNFNSESGKVSRKVFIQAINASALPFKNDKILKALFDRFKIDRNQANGKEDEKIDTLDFIISLIILARIDDMKQLDLIFHQTDVDENDCLSYEQIYDMIYRIENCFARENVLIPNESNSLLIELSKRRAKRKYKRTIDKIETIKDKEEVTDQNKNQILKKKVEEQDDDDKLIKWDEFQANLESQQKLLDMFLPPNYQLYDILFPREWREIRERQREQMMYDSKQKEESKLKREKEKVYVISNKEVDKFQQFRKVLHCKIRSNYQDPYYNQIIKQQQNFQYPGIIQIDGARQRLPNLQRTANVNEFYQEKVEMWRKDFDTLTELDIQKDFKKLINENNSDKNVNLQNVHNTNSLEVHLMRKEQMNQFKKDQVIQNDDFSYQEKYTQSINQQPNTMAPVQQ